MNLNKISSLAIYAAILALPILGHSQTMWDSSTTCGQARNQAGQQLISRGTSKVAKKLHRSLSSISQISNRSALSGFLQYSSGNLYQIELSGGLFCQAELNPFYVTKAPEVMKIRARAFCYNSQNQFIKYVEFVISQTVRSCRY